MAETIGQRIFISYSTKDGSEFADDLRQKLEAEGFSIWQDLIALEGGRDWWSQIEDALKSESLQHFLLVVTPKALASHVVRQEIRLARQEGKTFCPIKGPGMPSLAGLPHWLGQIYDLDREEHRTTLIRVLEGPSRQKRVPMMAPEPPEEFVPRPREFKALKAQLLDAETQDAVAITAALRGAGGYGKTTLARALAHDPEIVDAFFDGILWVELGEQGGARVLPAISDLVTLIDGEPSAISTLDGARTALGKALGDRRMLLVVDDVWNKAHLNPFLHGGAKTARLVTSLRDGELPAYALRHAVDRMQASEGLALIGWRLPEDQVEAYRPALAALSERLGDWAQLLKLANGFLRDRVLKHKRPLEAAIADVTKRLEKRGFTAFDDSKAEDYAARHDSVALMMETSLELLEDDNKRERFGELGIFPEDADIPLGIVQCLWRETGGLDDIDSEDLLSECHDLSLLLSLDLDQRTLRFHDTVRQYLQNRAGTDRMLAQHRRLLSALEDMGGPETESTAERRYYFTHLPEHLAAAGARSDLDALLLDPGWLRAKLDITESPLSLIADYDLHSRNEAQRLIGRTLRLIWRICDRDPRQLVPQLYVRLISSALAMETGFVDRLRKELPLPSLVTTQPHLTPPGAETGRLRGHTNWVAALEALPNGRLASGSLDQTIRLWDLASGAETGRCYGHAKSVIALALLPDGTLASGSHDRTIRLWDIERCAETHCFRDHKNSVSALAVLPDSRLASGSHDKTIRLWDLTNRAAIDCVEGHTGGVKSLALLPDGRLASGSHDRTIRLWDLANRAETVRLEGHTDGVTALAVLPDGRLASGSLDKTIRLWDLTNCAETDCLKGHTNWVNAVAVLPDGRLVSGSYDNTIRLWDTEKGEEIARLEIDHPVLSLFMDANHRIIISNKFGRLQSLEIIE